MFITNVFETIKLKILNFANITYLRANRWIAKNIKNVYCLGFKTFRTTTLNRGFYVSNGLILNSNAIPIDTTSNQYRDIDPTSHNIGVYPSVSSYLQINSSDENVERFTPTASTVYKHGLCGFPRCSIMMNDFNSENRGELFGPFATHRYSLSNNNNISIYEVNGNILLGPNDSKSYEMVTGASFNRILTYNMWCSIGSDGYLVIDGRNPHDDLLSTVSPLHFANINIHIRTIPGTGSSYTIKGIKNTDTSYANIKSGTIISIFNHTGKQLYLRNAKVTSTSSPNYDFYFTPSKVSGDYLIGSSGTCNYSQYGTGGCVRFLKYSDRHLIWIRQ